MLEVTVLLLPDFGFRFGSGLPFALTAEVCALHGGACTLHGGVVEALSLAVAEVPLELAKAEAPLVLAPWELTACTSTPSISL